MWIERAVINQYDHFTHETSEAGRGALAFVNRVVWSPVIQKFFSQAAHTAANRRKLEYAKRDPTGNVRHCSGQWRGVK